VFDPPLIALPFAFPRSMDYLEAQQTSFPDLSAHFNELGDLWKKK
jgi:hypothetical protein